MKLVYKGTYTGEGQLPKGILPPNAVRFIEPETPVELNRAAMVFMLPALGFIALIMLGSAYLHGGIQIQVSLRMLESLLLAFVSMPVHELLHAICFTKVAEVGMYVSFKNLMMFVHCTEPVSKARFVFLSLLPSVVLGWILLLIWAILPYGEGYSDTLFWFSVLSVLFGVGDYLNVYNALRQMPKGSMQQLSGFHSYWFLP